MKRREVEIFMAVKEIGDYVIQAMRNGKAVTVDYDGVVNDINKRFDASIQLKSTELTVLINNYIYNNCPEFRECGCVVNGLSRKLELVNRRETLNDVFKDFIACGGNKIISRLKAGKGTQAVLCLEALLKMVEDRPELNCFDVTVDELEYMLTDYVNKNCGSMKIVREKFGDKLHMIAYTAA